ncbi:hypothetical protein [Leptodesmis sichuanensis]|uniref:hypothetical protein n=1 Tax=Leptodesmis sichuanensis TaxID=2906798 RepID=UPI001F2E25F2|nr:hypothetical protein [Leptodesmis sichuanensis]UIE39292.1 hypothetical protein KIK02_06865 [Leptodesmis sichuanensis A121]
MWCLLQLPVGAKYHAGKFEKNAFLELSEGRESLDRWLSNQKIHVETLANTAQVRSMDWAKTEPYLKAEILRFSDLYAIAIGKPDGWRNVIGASLQM